MRKKNKAVLEIVIPKGYEIDEILDTDETTEVLAERTVNKA